jgi:hypothetical protein
LPACTSTRPRLDQGQREVIGELSRLIGTKITVKRDIEAANDDAFDAKVVRDANENANTLKFEQHGFE